MHYYSRMSKSAEIDFPSDSNKLRARGHVESVFHILLHPPTSSYPHVNKAEGSWKHTVRLIASKHCLTVSLNLPNVNGFCNIID